MVADRPELLTYRMLRGADDSNFVVLLETWESREGAEALMSSPELQQELVEHGVDTSSVTLDWLDDVGSGSR